MKTKILFAVLAVFLLASTAASAADGKITISAPAKDAMVGASEKIMITYDAVLGPKGDHLHLYLDGKKLEVLRQIKGTAEVGMLPPGKHHLCLTINTSWHMSTGVEECVDVTSK